MTRHPVRWAATLILTSVLALALVVERTAAAPWDFDDSAPLPTPSPWPASASVTATTDNGLYAAAAFNSMPCGGDGIPCSKLQIAHQMRPQNRLGMIVSTDKGATFGAPFVIDDGDGEAVGAYASIATGIWGYPTVISYQNADQTKLKIAHTSGVFNNSGNCGGGKWQCETLGIGGLHSAIALEGDGTVDIVHVNGQNLRLRRGSPPYRPADFPASQSFIVPDGGAGTITSASVAADSIGQVHIAFTDFTCVYYTYLQLTTFGPVEKINCAPSNATLPLRAGGVEIKVSNGRLPRISYILNSSTGYRVKYAYKAVDYDNENYTEKWIVRSVSPNYTTLPQPGTSLVIDFDTGVAKAISWGSVSGSTRRLMVALPSFGLDSWDSGAIADATGGAYSSMVFIGGKPAVAHYDTNLGNLRFSKKP
jgi:hypothetical protein